MQQLVWQFSLLEQRNIIELELSPSFDWESFGELAERFCMQFKVQEVSLSLGADRAQLHFRGGLGDFLLYYEALCDSFWIEVFATSNKKQLTAFYDFTEKVLQKKC